MDDLHFSNWRRSHAWRKRSDYKASIFLPLKWTLKLILHAQNKGSMLSSYVPQYAEDEESVFPIKERNLLYWYRQYPVYKSKLKINNSSLCNRTPGGEILSVPILNSCIVKTNCPFLNGRRSFGNFSNIFSIDVLWILVCF